MVNVRGRQTRDLLICPGAFTEPQSKLREDIPHEVDDLGKLCGAHLAYCDNGGRHDGTDGITVFAVGQDAAMLIATQAMSWRLALPAAALEGAVMANR